MADSVIKEGFLCPICMQDLGSVADLQTHFDVAHAGEDKAVLNQLKDIFGKAKQKILSSMKKEKESEDVYSAFSGEDNEPVSDAGRLNAGGIDPTMWEPQEIGATRSYTDGFKRYRDARMDRFVVETNKLIIRLDKLLSTDAPTEASKRKAFEKSVVPWAPDKDVTLCTACGKSFSLTRRRHHCRLCGGIICNRCSHFLPFCYARALTDPAFQYQGEGFRRSSSTSSLNSILSPEGEPHIRTCQPCRTLLERRDQQIEQRNRKPFVVQLYQKMRAYMDESNRILPKFLDMAESLHSGETTYNLREATAYRAQLVKLFENIELISKRIYTLGTSDPEETPSPTALRLQKMVRSHASSYLTQNMMGLVSLPSDADLTALQEQKTLEAQQRVEDERRRAAERAQRAPPPRDLPASTDPPKKPDKSPTDSQKSNESLGWKPAEISLGNSDDPMIQQMSIIRGYARQARQAGRWDEVKMLEDNLRELQKEYWRQAEVDKEQQAASQARVGAHGATQQEQAPPRQPQPQQQARHPSQQQQARQQPQQQRQQSQPQQQTQARQQQPRQQPQPQRQSPQRQSPQRQLNTQRQHQSQPQQQHRTSPRKTPPRGSPVKTPASKDSSLNPFDEDEDVDGDEMNPFSANYKDQNPFHQGNDLNPFS